MPKLPVTISYALLGLPLAFFALPVYVHVPKLYGDHLGLSLTGVGLVLLAVRLLDAVFDPLIGRWCDRQQRRKQMLLFSLPLLIVGWLLLFMPPQWVGASVYGFVWLAGGLVLAYAGYSLATINHNAWGAEFPANNQGRLQANAWREGAALVGVMMAAALPSVLANDLPQGLALLSYFFIPILLFTTWLALTQVPASHRVSHAHEASIQSLWRSAAFRHLLLVYALNGIAAAVPATLVLFYVADVLSAPEWSGAFLVIYFLAAALALPFWVVLASRVGRLCAWRMAMLLAMASFAFTPWLTSGDIVWFACICLVSGVALGADLALPPALLAEHVASHGRAAGSYGWWAAVSKLNLALAAGIALPLVAALGYVPSAAAGAGTVGLAWVYGGLPLALKLVAFALLVRAQTALSPLDKGVSS